MTRFTAMAICVIEFLPELCEIRGNHGCPVIVMSFFLEGFAGTSHIAVGPESYRSENIYVLISRKVIQLAPTVYVPVTSLEESGMWQYSNLKYKDCLSCKFDLI